MQTKSILLLTVGLAAGLLEPGITFIKKPVNRRIAVVTPVLAAAANLFPSPALAKGSSIPSHLASYGLPPPPPLPKGFSQILKPYGRTPNRVTKLVQFAGVSHSTPLHSVSSIGFFCPLTHSLLHAAPKSWVLIIPNQDANGEEGSIQAGNYGAGDTATFFNDDTNKEKFTSSSLDNPKTYAEVSERSERALMKTSILREMNPAKWLQTLHPPTTKLTHSTLLTLHSFCSCLH